MESVERKQALLYSLGLVLAVFALYWPVRGHDFVSYDDDVYVSANPHVAGGLEWGEIGWVFTHGYGANYHPLTWVAHMLDVELFGLAPGPHHLMNVGLHALNAVLVLFLCRALLGGFSLGALAAGLFALHPLRVESVAWASERKDVLCATFLLSGLLAYLAYGRAPSPRRYLVVVLFLVLALLAKPMAVTFPCLVLLLDLWPLRRLEATTPWHPAYAPDGSRSTLVFFEKLPLFALAGLGALSTWIAQEAGGAASATQVVPMEMRLWNAFVSYGVYLRETLWPVGLSVFHPHAATVAENPRAELIGPALLAALVLAVLSGLAWRLRLRAPGVLMGWCWFLGSLVPVIGLKQVGVQAHADRYTYIPSIGLVVALLGAARLLGPRWAKPLAGLGLVCAVVASGATRRQISVWRDTGTLFEHALEVDSQNYLAHTNLASALLDQNDLTGAEEHLRAALAIRADLDVARNSLGLALARQGRTEEALAAFEEALDTRPSYAEAHANRGVALRQLGRAREACDAFRRALELDESLLNAANALALVLASAEDDALRNGAEALRWATHSARATENGYAPYLETLAAAHAETGDFEAAVRWQSEALQRLAPNKRRSAEQRLTLYRAGRPLRQSL